MNVDYLIVGQGIAGSMLSCFLLQAGKKVLVVDDGHKGAASPVSLGLLNPITGRNLNKAWKADMLLPFAKKTYQALEEKLGLKCYREINSLRLFIDEKQQQRWQKKKDAPEIRPHVVAPIAENPYLGKIVNLYGGVEITGSALVDNKKMLKSYRDDLIGQGAYLQDSVEASKISMGEQEIKWKHIIAAKMIFCDGYKAAQNPFFDWLPVSPNKGEALLVQIPDLTLDKIINKNFFVAPYGDGLFRIGATHNWTEVDNLPSEKGKDELLKKLADAIRLPCKINLHEAGVRPTSSDRKPIIGLHPKYPQIGIFNGLGAKGFSQAPYFAHQFAAYLLGRGQLDEEVKIARFL
jgi:glycine/D-amino acid oxidase-like deaminating enzyme